MSKLYPPSIEGKLPAFAGQTLKVPLTMNRAVNMIEVKGMKVMIKTVQTGTLKATLDGSLSYNASTGQYSAVFELGGFNPNLGQYYKVQIAYVDRSGEVGYYSTIGVIKYTSYPSVTIPNLIGNFYGSYDYVGLYSQADVVDKDESGNEVVTLKRDGTEKIYSYCFELTDRDGQIVATSGVQLHNSSTDMLTTESSDKWSFRRELEKNIPYYLTYKVTTMNGLEASSARYTVMDQESVDAEVDAVLTAELNYDDGCIGLYFCPLSKPGKDVIINGSFVLARSSSVDNFSTWEEVYRFSYSNVSFRGRNKILLWEDFTVQQGEEYMYSIQAYNSYGLYSNRMFNVNNIEDQVPMKIYADFEDAFLYDGARQLKIRFNPKVASFKATVLENKVNTIGSQYPFVFRSGSVNYKEFPISGLISLLSDPSEKFIQGIQSENLFPNRQGTPSLDSPHGLDTNLTSYNIQRERQFKLEALEWLNDGKPKLFRSPTEGNYIVRLMNVSLTPNDTLGRMLHTFNCTAYEIAEYNFSSLISLGLVSLPSSNTTNLKIGQIQPRALMLMNEQDRRIKYPDFLVNGNILSVPSIFRANITEAIPGTVVGFNFADGNEIVRVEIGGTGSYYVQVSEYPLTSITLLEGDWSEAKLTFEYYDDTPTDAFSQVARLTLTDEIRQFIGTGMDINLIENIGLKDIRRELGQFHYIKVTKRLIENLWLINGKLYNNEYGDSPMQDEDWNPAVIYHVVNDGKNTYYDGSKNKTLKGAPDFRLRLNSDGPNDYVDFGGRQNEPDDSKFGDTFGRVDAWRNIEKVSELRIGNGLMVDVAYRVRTKEYVVENTNSTVEANKTAWLSQMDRIASLIQSPHMTEPAFRVEVAEANRRYNTFIRSLETALKLKGE